MLRLDYFLMRGGLLVNGDLVSNQSGSQFAVELDDGETEWNEDEPANKYCHIHSFTPRTNNGKQPMPDDFPVILNYGRSESKTTARLCNHWASSQLLSWVPDLEKLLEQQGEYDKAQAEHDVMISEKDKMIVDAVNQLGVDIEWENVRCIDGDVPVILYRKQQGYVIGTTGYEVGFYALVCTSEEHNQCIREMSAGAFVPNAKPEFVYGQDVYLKGAVDSERAFKFGCLSLDGESAIVLYEGGCAYATLDNLSSKPFKTKEEIELEEAKKLQILELMYFYQKHYDRVGVEDFFKDMQENGHLAEILLPLEPKQ